MNDKFAFACGAELVYVHDITKGRNMEKEHLEDIINEDNYIKGKNLALHFLERSFKSITGLYFLIIMAFFKKAS